MKLAEAKHNFFLGFGFHPINVERLNLIKHTKGKHVRTTLYNVEENEKKYIFRNWPPGSRIEMFAFDVKSLQFLRTYIPWVNIIS